MAHLSLSKSSLSVQNRRLKGFERFLPSLDLKRRQLIAERAKAAKAIEATEAEINQLRRLVEQGLPMGSNEEVNIENLVHITKLELKEENVMGVRLPLVKNLKIKQANYALMAKPEWVDNFALRLTEMLELRIHIQLQQQRLTLLNKAVRTITQRVNLFEKVLIPQTRDNIRRIQIFLADAERAAVVRAKIAKGKRLREGIAV
ncbi:MAG: V-type ATP synthase subunit D [Candidatus Thiodiazotropha sp.]|jgi:V/A-type H+/Na+-transporting ATPase subunit D